MKNLVEMLTIDEASAQKFEFTEERPLYQVAQDIKKAWKPKVSPYAKDYLDAMMCLDSVDDDYMQDSGRSIVNYFLSNAQQFKGDEAKKLKAELKWMLKKKK